MEWTVYEERSILFTHRAPRDFKSLIKSKFPPDKPILAYNDCNCDQFPIKSESGFQTSEKKNLEFQEQSGSGEKNVFGEKKRMNSDIYDVHSRSFENSYISENQRTLPISYISQTVILFKNRLRDSPKLFERFLNKNLKCEYMQRNKTENMHMCKKKKILHICKVFEKKIVFSEFFFATGLPPEVGFSKKFPQVGFSKKLTRERESRSFENSYIPENPRTPKPLTFSKNRLRGAKNRLNISPVAKKNFRKNNFFFFKKFAYVQKKNFVHISLYTTYLKGFVKKNLKKKRKKKSCIYAKIKKKSCLYAKVEKKYPNFIHSKRFGGFRSRFFEMNNGLGDIGNWGSSRDGSNENNYWI
ncbi:hypothetical protein LXL04_039316 [Taraxacum kok-saghyz]